MAIIIQREDGGVSVMRLHAGDIDQEVAKWEANGEYKAAAYWEVADADIPPDRSFRDAWVIARQAINVDMEKARNVHKNRLRAEREALLAELDVQYLRAVESGNVSEASRISARKQQLRDVTKDPAIESARTPEELKQAAVAVLRG
jgi:hypothetical protein